MASNVKPQSNLSCLPLHTLTNAPPAHLNQPTASIARHIVFLPAQLRQYCTQQLTGFLALQFTFLQDDVGIPLNYRHMEGFGVHTFTLINKEGKITYVKFHWKPTCGVKCLLEEEAIQVGGSNHSHATKVCSGCRQSWAQQ